MYVVVLGAAATLGAGLVVAGPRWGAVLGIALAALIGSAARDDSVRLALLLIPAMALVRRLTGGPRAYVPDDPLVLIVPLLLIPALLALSVVALDRRLDRTRVLWWSFLLWSAIVTLVVPGPALSVRVYGLLSVLVPAIVGYAVFEGLHRHLPRAALMSVLVLAPIAAVYGLIQYLLDPRWDIAWLADRQEDLVSVGQPSHGQYRIFGSMEAPLPFALYLGLGIIALAAWTLWSPARPGWGIRVVRLAMAALLVTALVLTATRSVLFGLPLAAGVALWLVPGRRSGAGIVLVGLAAAALIALPGVAAEQLYDDDRQTDRLQATEIAGDTSLLARLDLLNKFELVLQAPWGTGLGSSGQATRLETGKAIPNIDNGYLALAQESGVVGLTFFLLLLHRALFDGRRALARLRGAEGLALGGSLLGVLYFTVMLLTGSVLSLSSALLFWIFLGLGTREAALARHAIGATRPIPADDRSPSGAATLVANRIGSRADGEPAAQPQPGTKGHAP